MELANSSWSVGNLLPLPEMKPMAPDRGGYTLTMRECAGSEECLAFLESETDGNGSGARLHIGWGSFRNLDVIAARRSRWALLLDVNLHQFRVWEAVRRALQIAADPMAFVEAVTSLLPTQPRLRQFSTSTHTWLRGEFERPGSWLFEARPDRYRHVRAIFGEGRLATACADLRAPRPADGEGWFDALANRLQHAPAEGAVTDTLYVSNIPWMLAQPTGFFGESHAPFAVAGTSLLQQVRSNLAATAKPFRHVVSAMRLRPDATADNLQWFTEIQRPAAFLDERNWSGLTQPPSAAR